MSAAERVQSVQRRLTFAAVFCTLLWAVAGWTVVVLIGALADAIAGLPLGARKLVAPSAVAVAALVAIACLWRLRRLRSLEATALWLEERIPALRYAAVTAIEPRFAHLTDALDEQVPSASVSAVVRRALTRAVVLPAGVLALATGMLLILPSDIVARVRVPRPGDSLARAPLARTEGASRLTPLIARVQPPGYSGLAAVTVDEPTSVGGLVGSRVVFEGRGAASGISATVAADPPRSAVSFGDRWRVELMMPSRPAALRLHDRGFNRLVALEPRPDSAPVVTMTSPVRDTVLRTASGRIALAAEARDDLGLAAGWFEYIISSGEGETFTFRSGMAGQVLLSGTQATLATTVVLDSLRLSPGDVVHLRAAGRDRRPDRRAGTAASETRTIRVARVGEYDSVAVEGAPPPEADTSALSQRMLIILTERLVRRVPRLTREVTVSESRRIAVDQTRLRRRVGDIIFSRLGGEEGAEHSHGPGEEGEEEQRGEMTPEQLLRAAEEATQHAVGEAIDFAEGESPIVAINRPLLEAYNAMWDASTELNVGEPKRALPHMYAALAAIERARRAERIYLRGRPPTVVVDLNKVRLAGTREPAPIARRTPQPAIDTATAQRVERFERAVSLVARGPDGIAAASDSLLVLRLELLTDAPAAAAAVDDAVRALRSAGDATQALVRARRALAGSAATRGTLGGWDGW